MSFLNLQKINCKIQIKKIKLFFIYRKFEKSEIYKNAKIKFKLGSNFYKLGLEFDNSFEKIIAKNKYLFDIFKKEISPRPIVETTERSNLTTEGFEKGRKLQITYYDTTLKIESNKTLSQTLKDLQKIYNK